MKKLIFLLVFAARAFAHEDTMIEINGSELLGLPTAYQPSSFDIETLTLKVKNLSVTFPACFTSRFSWNEQVEIYSSWYHDPKLFGVPAYIVFISPETEFGLMLDLKSLKPILINAGFVDTEQKLNCIGEFRVIENET
ncbi:MAG: hypothetical protein Alis3KO_41170 [Aliiglaciecola sp.]